MKKRIIWLVVLMLLAVAAILVVVVPEVRALVSGTGIYAWAKENMYDVYYMFRYGAGRFAYVSIVLLVFVGFLVFTVMKVPAVKESDVEPKAVVQKPTIKKENGKVTVVVVEESEGGK